MSETSNIAKMAEHLSTELFAEFLWKRSGPVDQNWKCVVPEHGKETHPSDVVFYYDEPYSLARTYVNCDLKSYSASSISTAASHSAVKNLALALGCAEQSDDWRQRYLHDDASPSICGLLFVYNHDGAYSRAFSELFRTIKFDDITIPRGSKLVVFGPDDIQWLDNVHYEINYMRGKGEVPAREFCRFYYPHLVQKKNVQLEKARAAILEMLTSPWITMLCEQPNSAERIVLIFYRDRGSSTQEFLYLIDTLMHFQLIDTGVKVRIRTLDADTTAAVNFAKAVDEYVIEYGGGPETKDRLKSIEFRQIHKIHTSFSEVEIGMSRG